MKKFFKSLFYTNDNGDSHLNFYIYALIVFGFICSTSASITAKAQVLTIVKSAGFYALFLTVGIIIYHFCSNFYTTKLNKNEIFLYVVGFGVFVLLCLALLCCYMISGPKNNNYSWIWFRQFPSFSIQPSEFVKPAMIILLAGYICDVHSPSIKFWDSIKKPLFFLIIFVTIILIGMKDMGTLVVVLGVTLICFWIPKDKRYAPWQITTLILTFVVVGFACFLLTPAGADLLAKLPANIQGRFEAVIAPSRYSDATREIFYSLLGISKGGLTGVGLGESVQKFGYLASASADYIFAIIVEELGLFGIIVTFYLYGAIIFLLIKYSFSVNKDSDKVILVGCAALMFIHFFLNIGGVSGLIPLTGVPLILVSRGGSAAISLLAILGCAQAVIANNKATKRVIRKVKEVKQPSVDLIK